MRIIEDDLSGAEVAELLGEHLASMAEHSPPESIHALELTAPLSNRRIHSMRNSVFVIAALLAIIKMIHSVAL